MEGDEVLARLILHALETRGYRTRWIDDGDRASRELGGPRPTLRADLVTREGFARRAPEG